MPQEENLFVSLALKKVGALSDEVGALSDSELQERADSLAGARRSVKERLDELDAQHYVCITESSRREAERKRAEELAQAELFVVFQWEYEDDLADGEDWGDFGACILPLSQTTEAWAGGFHILLGKEWIRLIFGEEDCDPLPWDPLPEIRYPVGTKEIFFCSEGKDQKFCRATFFGSLQEAEAFLAQYKKAPKEE
jgi:hypothetical protein